MKRDSDAKKRLCTTEKYNCPFRLRDVNVDGDNWKVVVQCGVHNHELLKTLVGIHMPED